MFVKMKLLSGLTTPYRALLFVVGGSDLLKFHVRQNKVVVRSDHTLQGIVIRCRVRLTPSPIRQNTRGQVNPPFDPGNHEVYGILLITLRGTLTAHPGVQFVRHLTIDQS